MRTAILLLLATILGVAGGLAACGDHQRRHVVRLVGDPGIKRDDPMLAYGEAITIDGVPRPVISASKPIVPPSEETWTQGHRVGATIPPELAAVPWMMFATTVTRNGTTSVMRWLPVPSRQAGGHFEYGVVDDRVGPDGTVGIMLWPVPDLAKRDVETSELTIPAHARLDVGVAVEPQTRIGTALPIAMTVTAIAGTEAIVLHTVEVDPRREPDRGWKDVSISLTPVAGRTVRLRFSSRPVVGPTAMLGLPLWADPTIIDLGS